MQRLGGTTHRVTILDGGTGRELKKIGAPFRQPEWSALALMEAPECVTRVHERYIAAGADVITANSYAVVPFHIGADRFASDGKRLAALSGQLARSAASAVLSRHVRVAASLPPVCGSYRSDLFNAAAAAPVLRLLILALIPFADLWLAETLSAIEEAELVVAELAAAHVTAPLWLSFTIAEDGGAEPRLRSGELVSAAAIAASRLGAKAILFNCSQPEVMAAAVSVAAVALSGGGGICDVEIGCYANAFAPQTADAEANAGLSELREEVTPASYRTFAEEWVSRGATIVGGCCGIGPEHIAYLTASKAPK